MKSIFCIAIIIFSFILTEAQTLSVEKVKQIEQLISTKMSKDQIPGLSVAIVVEKKMIWSRGYGLADLENFVPAKANTAYRSASIGKPITATAVMQLVEKGKLDLDAPIQQYCQVYPKKQWILTSRHLLAHLGGIRHYGGPNAEQESFSTIHYETIAESLNVFKDDSLLFEPGTEFRYSTYGYNLLGCVIEGASGISFLTYMRDNIFLPAQMNNTRDDNPFSIIPNRASGYNLDGKGELVNSRMVDMSNRMPAGGFITTVEDLAHFAVSIMKNKLISQQTFEQMLIPQKLKNGKTINYGLGWAVAPDDDWYGEKEASHGGQSPGVSGILYLIPRRNFAVAIQGNSERISDRSGMAANIAKIVLELGK